MEKVINSYEALFIVDVEAGEEAAKAVVTKFLNRIAKNGEIVEVADWGKRRLAYPIDDMTEGYYVLVDFNAPTSFIAELERIFGITEDIMRSIVKRKNA